MEDKGMVNQILIRPANSHISSTLTLPAPDARHEQGTLQGFIWWRLCLYERMIPRQQAHFEVR
jgi:hypothetical protein